LWLLLLLLVVPSPLAICGLALLVKQLACWLSLVTALEVAGGPAGRST
jgi:hypothetical protein